MGCHCLLQNMLSRLVITLLPRSKSLLISWLQSPSTVILQPKKIKSDKDLLYHRLNGHGFEEALGDGESQGSLVCCRPWDVD